MKYSIFFILIWIKSCQSQTDKPVIPMVPPRITIEYLNEVNDYKIKIIWIPNKIASEQNDKIVGPAILELKKKDGTTYYANYTNFSIDIPVKNLKIKNGFVQSFTPTNIQKKYNSDEDPFRFQDVNFDKEKEFIILETGLADYYRSTYRVFEFDNNKTLNELTEEPFNLFGNETLDYKKKEIMIPEYFTCCENTQYYYKVKDSRDRNIFMLYKTEIHKFNPNTNVDSITIKEKGKLDIKKVTKQMTEF